MTLRTKTIEYTFPASGVTGSLASATRLNFGAITLDIPETTSRTFKCVYGVVNVYSACTAGGQQITAGIVGAQLGAVAFADVTLDIQPAGTAPFGENMAGAVFHSDFTSYFNNNFGAGSTQTCGMGVKFTGPITANICPKLVITYEYDDSAAVHVKTVKIPCEGYSGALPVSSTEIGTREVPLMNTFCPEYNKVFKNLWFEIATAEEDRGALFALSMSLDAEVAVTDGNHVRTLSTSNDANTYFFNWVRNDIDTTVTHSVKLRGNGATNFYNPTVVLGATYIFTASLTSSSLNSLVIPMKTYDNGDPTATNPVIFNSTFWVEEPNPILVQSAIFAQFAMNQSAIGLSSAQLDVPTFSICTQSIRTYTTPYLAGAPALHGFPCIMQRFDNNALKGNGGFVLSRGKNSISGTIYHSGNAGTGWSYHGAILYVNYTSDIAARGIGGHNRTTKWLYLSSSNADPVGVVSVATVAGPTRVPSISEPYWWINSVGCVSMLTAQNNSTTIQAKYLLGESYGAGTFFLSPVWCDMGFTTSRFMSYATDLTSFSYRWPQEIDSARVNFTTSRKIVLNPTINSIASYAAAELYMTSHNITFATTGSVRGYSGTGAGISVAVFNANTLEFITSGTTIVGGTYALTGYDSVYPVFSEARQDITHLGRSDNFFLT